MIYHPTIFSSKLKVMNKVKLKFLLIAIMLLVFSCGNPETTVTDIIHPDGSITRHIEMRGSDNKFDPEDIQVPYDSTWHIRDTIEIENGKDTIWIRTAEKGFSDADEITSLYGSGRNSNPKITRSALFLKRFRWFFSTMKFAEKVDNTFRYGYPVEEYLSDEELDYFYLPDNICKEKESGPDSTVYKELSKRISEKVERWMSFSIISEWIEEFSAIMGDNADEDVTRESLRSREELASKLVSDGSDSLIFSTLLGDRNYEKFSVEADSATRVIEDRFDAQFSFVGYNVKFIMPGKVISTNGFIDSSGVISWPVKAEYFFTSPYEMWAESKLTNIWAWIISGIFLLFVIAGLFIRRLRRR